MLDESREKSEQPLSGWSYSHSLLADIQIPHLVQTAVARGRALELNYELSWIHSAVTGLEVGGVSEKQ